MSEIRPARSALRWLTVGLAAGAGLAAATYATYACVRWLRFGRSAPPTADEADALLDQFMPAYDVVERRRIRVAAPADTVMAAASEFDIRRSPIIQAIFRSRAALLGGELEDPEEARRPRALIAWAQSIGWRALAEVPGHEIILGTITQPWKVNPAFRAPGPEEYARFREPGYVKIIWTLRADPTGEAASIFRHETRAWATDPSARAIFRRYWAAFSPGIVVIRWLALGPIKREAERRASRGARAGEPHERPAAAPPLTSAP
ncbi:MAG TPA: hypothetical protein VFQ25_05975 [Ktedonobacterales bacterium]|nr:hypothetical protein [Ktedonobacterales bacterium]